MSDLLDASNGVRPPDQGCSRDYWEDLQTMSRKQDAVLWWRQLFIELGSSAVRSSAGDEGQLARRRVRALVNLFFAILDKSATTSLIEIGAHNADASKRFVHASESRRAIAYEAAPIVYQRAVDAGIPDRIEMINEAVGAVAGEATFYVPMEERLLKWGSTRRRSGDLKAREITVPMVTLDQAAERVAARAGTNVRDIALWIDVEGAALDVFKGGAAVLRDRVSAIYVEVNDNETYEGSSTSLDILELLLAHDFIPVARDNQYKDAWNLLAAHADTYGAAREAIAKWTYAHSLIPAPSPGRGVPTEATPDGS